MDENGIVREIGIAPRPLQTPRPKIYGAFAYSMRTVDMWAREGGKQVVFATDLDFCEALWKQLRPDDSAGRTRCASRRDRCLGRLPHPH